MLFRHFIVVVIISVLSACGVKYTIDDVPKEEDFALSKDSLVEKYPAIETAHPDHLRYPVEGLYYSDLVALWGQPDEESKDWLNAGFQYGMINIFAYYVPNEPSLEAFALMNGFVWLFANPHEVRIWNKGDYQVVATFMPENLLGIRENQLQHWTWKHLDSDQNVYADWLKPNMHRFFLQWGIGLGEGNHYSNQNNKGTLRSAFSIALGLRQAVNYKSTVSLSYGIETGGFSNESKFYQVGYDVIDLGLDYKTKIQSLRGVAGIQYLTDGSLKEHRSFSSFTYELEDRFAAYIGLDVDMNAKTTLGFRHRVGKLTAENDFEVDIQSTFLTFTSRFF